MPWPWQCAGPGPVQIVSQGTHIATTVCVPDRLRPYGSAASRCMFEQICPTCSTSGPDHMRPEYAMVWHIVGHNFQVLPCITGLCKTNARAIAICPRICSGIGPRIDRKCSGITH